MLTEADLTGKRRHKFGAIKETVDGITFHSRKEANRYRELKMLVLAGQIEFLALQPSFSLSVNNVQIGLYIGDFQYDSVVSGEVIVEDVKGVDTPLSKWKRRHMKAQYGIEVRIV